MKMEINQLNIKNTEMKKELRIFARFNSREKVAVLCYRRDVPDIIEMLNTNIGLSWVSVDTIEDGEAIQFFDETTYKGFEQNKDRYSNAIFKL